jgi:hypothetical protein
MDGVRPYPVKESQPERLATVLREGSLPAWAETAPRGFGARKRIEPGAACGARLGSIDCKRSGGNRLNGDSRVMTISGTAQKKRPALAERAPHCDV